MKKIYYLLTVAMCIVACKKENAKVSTEETKVVAHSKPTVLAANTTLSFSGYTWNVTPTSQQNPASNYWNANNAYVDGNGWLHLKITKNTSTNHWECAQLQSTTSFGYGTYQWQVEGAIDKLDKNIVFGLFDYSGVDGRDEIDIEYSRYGNASYANLNYVQFPQQGSSKPTAAYSQEFSLPNGTYTTQRFTRTSSSTNLKTLFGFQSNDTNLYLSKTFSAPTYSISTLKMPILMNLWLFGGNAPSNNQSVEIIIHNFKFTAQ